MRIRSYVVLATTVGLCIPTLAARGQHMLTSYYRAPHAWVAANRWLPKGTRLKLVNPANGRSTEVVIDDRGPFVRGRSLDISIERARELGFIRKGVAVLEVQRLH